MLLNNFFEIKETINNATEDGQTVAVTLLRAHPVYEGHFPGNPVVPGVCLIQMIKEIVEIKNGRSYFLGKTDNVKFLNVINPDINPDLSIDLTYKQTDHFQIKATISFKEKVFLKFSGTFS